MPARRTSSERLLDIREAIAKIERFLAGRNFAAFTSEAMLHDAIVRNLEIISEESRFLPEDIRALEPGFAQRGSLLSRRKSAVNAIGGTSRP